MEIQPPSNRSSRDASVHSSSRRWSVALVLAVVALVLSATALAYVTSIPRPKGSTESTYTLTAAGSSREALCPSYRGGYGYCLGIQENISIAGDGVEFVGVNLTMSMNSTCNPDEGPGCFGVAMSFGSTTPGEGGVECSVPEGNTSCSTVGLMPIGHAYLWAYEASGELLGPIAFTITLVDDEDG